MEHLYLLLPLSEVLYIYIFIYFIYLYILYIYIFYIFNVAIYLSDWTPNGECSGTHKSSVNLKDSPIISHPLPQYAFSRNQKQRTWIRIKIWESCEAIVFQH